MFSKECKYIEKEIEVIKRIEKENKKQRRFKKNNFNNDVFSEWAVYI